MAVSEYEVENLFIERLGTIGYQFIQLRDYAEVKKNFKDQLQKFNKAAIIESKGNSELSDSEFDRLLTQIENKTVFDSAKILRDKQLLELDIQFKYGFRGRSILTCLFCSLGWQFSVCRPYFFAFFRL